MEMTDADHIIALALITLAILAPITAILTDKRKY